MFLRHRTHSPLANERGSSLLAVIGLMAVAVVATLAIAGSTMNSLGVSSATRAGVQAQSAAEAGIDVALLKLTTASCTATTISTAAPEFEVDISQSTSTTVENWTDACPIDDTKRVKIISTGTAKRTDLTSNAPVDTHVIEAIYAFDAATVATPATGADAALYSYSTGSFSGSSILDSTTDSLPTMMVKEGNVTCDASGILKYNLVVDDGALEIGGSCQIRGNVWASSFDALGSVKIAGSVWTTGAALMAGSAQVFGGLTAGSISLRESAIVHKDAWSAGSTFMGPTASQIGGDLTTKSWDTLSSGYRIGGSTNIVASGPTDRPADPPVPSVPDWVDVDYVQSDWVKEGFTIVEMSDGCNMGAIQDVLTPAAGAPEGPVLINALGCPQGIKFKEDGIHLSIPIDLVIFASRFDIGSDAQIDGVGADRKLWLITPDRTPDTQPSCKNASGNSNVSKSFIVNTTISAMLYSPCQIKVGTGESHSAQWNGQFYGGIVSLTGSSQLHYAPIGIPGTAITAGGAPGSLATEAKLGARISIRDLNG